MGGVGGKGSAGCSPSFPLNNVFQACPYGAQSVVPSLWCYVVFLSSLCKAGIFLMPPPACPPATQQTELKYLLYARCWDTAVNRRDMASLPGTHSPVCEATRKASQRMSLTEVTANPSKSVFMKEMLQRCNEGTYFSSGGQGSLSAVETQAKNKG